MIKKEYLTPSMKVVLPNHCSRLLAGSTYGMNEELQDASEDEVEYAW